jgi:hypothetical protein
MRASFTWSRQKPEKTPNPATADTQLYTMNHGDRLTADVDVTNITSSENQDFVLNL